MSNPLVSIIIPTFNRAYLIGETLDSVFAQTYTNWECIVVDDGSTDHTTEIMKKYLAKDGRFQFHHRPEDRPAGGNAARNFGFRVSKGEYINWLDSDDLFLPDKLSVQLDYMLNHKVEVHVCQGQFFGVGSQKEIHFKRLWPEKFPLEGDNIQKTLISDNLRWPSGAALWSRNVAKLNAWDEELLGAQEWAFHIDQALSLRHEDFAFLEKVLIHIRKTDSSITQNPEMATRYEAYLSARIRLLDRLDPDNKMHDQYFKSVYLFSMRYVKYLTSENSTKSVDALAKLIARRSYKKFLNFKFGLFIYKNFKKDYFLKRLFK